MIPDITTSSKQRFVQRRVPHPDALERLPLGMARKPGTRAGTEFVLFDVTYVDGSQRSNRRVPATVVAGHEGDAAASAFIAQQDREIAIKSGVPPIPIKAVRRSGKKAL